MKNKIITLITVLVLILSIYSRTHAQEMANTSNENANNINTTNNQVMQNGIVQNTVNELQTTHDQIKDSVDDSNSELTNVQTDLSDTMKEIEALNEKTLDYQMRIDRVNLQVSNLKESMARIEQELGQKEKEYESQKKVLEKRLVALYEIGQNKYLDVLLNATSISDFLSRYYLITEIAKYDEQALDDVEQQRNQIVEQKQELNNQMEQYKQAKDEVERTQIILENTLVVKNNYVTNLTKKEKDLQEQIDQSMVEMRNIEKEIVMLTTANIGTDYVGGVMAWPVPGYTRITSPFGMRVHPVTVIYKLHTGTDIGAPIGANFIAANDGVVIKAGFNKAYGNMVIIDHGGGVSTLYAHGSEILVTVGQQVKKGDPVLKVGMTGYATGPHAHFEVRVNGEYVQPLNFVDANQ